MPGELYILPVNAIWFLNLGQKARDVSKSHGQRLFISNVRSSLVTEVRTLYYPRTIFANLLKINIIDVLGN